MAFPVSRSESRSRCEPDASLLSRGFGWFGIALGMAGLTIPRMLVKAIDGVSARRASRACEGSDGGHRSASFALTINKPPAEVYAFYRRLSRLPLFIHYLAFVREADDTYAHWVAMLPGGGTVAWDTRIIEDRPGELLSWRSVEGSLIQTRGQVIFAGACDGNATLVRAWMQLDALGNKPSRRLAGFFTTAQIEGDLGRLKQALETASPRSSTCSSW